jgi:hypothetical protein
MKIRKVPISIKILRNQWGGLDSTRQILGLKYQNYPTYMHKYFPSVLSKKERKYFPSENMTTV